MSDLRKQEQEILAALDFEPSTACERPHVGALGTASWLMVNCCCGGSMQLCAEHAERGRAEWLVVLRQAKQMQCVHCGRIAVPVLHFYRLRGAS